MRFLKYIILFLVLCSIKANAQRNFTGVVIDFDNNKPIVGATISIVDGEFAVKSDESGIFIINARGEEVTVLVTAIGYHNISATLEVNAEAPAIIKLTRNIFAIGEVEVVSTGLQTISKERATGSFAVVNNQLLNRRVSTNLIDRLEDVTSGMVFNRDRSSSSSFNIRGQSGIFSNAQPLIVIDNFVYDGELENINPNDVESVTVLKDAAAASIWGARAGNGVVVITTKRGDAENKPHVAFNSNVTVGGKPNLFYQPRMNTSDFIEIERQLFAQGFYQSMESSTSKSPLTPVVEILIAQRDGLISESDANLKIEDLGKQDVRRDIEKYFYRPLVNQQHIISVDGGSRNHQYFYSAGFDRESHSLKMNGRDRLTLNISNAFQFLKNRLELKTDIYYTGLKTERDADLPIVDDLGTIAGNRATLLPYTRFVNENGTPLSIIRDYRAGFITDSEASGTLSWHYSPLEELYLAENYTKTTDYRINSHLRYNILSGLSLNLLYQFRRNVSHRHNRQSVDTYFTRNLINRYAQPTEESGFEYPIPIGDILSQLYGNANSHNVRGQLNYNLSKNGHELVALAGYELKDYNRINSNYRMYGYNDEYATNERVDYVTPYLQYHNRLSRTTIPFGNSTTDITDRFISYFTNSAYTYKNRYTLSASVRFDRSNLFGVRTNQQGVPLWSIGAMWIASNEDFYQSSWLPYLKIRATYGYSGNVDPSLSAFTTARFAVSNLIIPAPYATIANPPNPNLRWERIKTINIGVDFATKENRLSGSVEFYTKRGLDLIGDIHLRPSTGVTMFRSNYAETKTVGGDLSLLSRNLTGKFGWNTNLLLSGVVDKVTSYDVTPSVSSITADGDWGQRPVEGRPLFSIYSFRWAGLDPETGSPRGCLNGELSQNYAQIISATTPDELVFNGPSRPPIFGSIRNSFSYGRVTLSANINFRLAYYFRLNGISYNSLLSGQGYLSGADYPLRWQQPGDESLSHVPSMPTALNYNRDYFYRYAEVLVERGDHIRLQDIQMEYLVNNSLFKSLPVSSIRVYVYANNIGLIWKRTNSRYDPDYAISTRPVRTISLGLNIHF